MKLQRLDHVNIRTTNIESLAAWYADILDLQPGWRPPFKDPGKWLYLGDQAILHLVDVGQAKTETDLQLEHFALSATGLPEFIARLTEKGIPYYFGEVPEAPIVQVNISDSDGNHIHVDFPQSEAKGIV